MRATMLAAAMACGLATGAEAAVVTVSGQLPGVDPYEAIGDAFLPAFDTTLGTLNSVTVHSQVQLASSLEVTTKTGGPLPAGDLFPTVFQASVIGAPPAYAAPPQLVATGITPNGQSGNGLPAGSATVRTQFDNQFTVAATPGLIGSNSN